MVVVVSLVVPGSTPVIVESTVVVVVVSLVVPGSTPVIVESTVVVAAVSPSDLVVGSPVIGVPVVGAPVVVVSAIGSEELVAFVVLASVVVSLPGVGPQANRASAARVQGPGRRDGDIRAAYHLQSRTRGGRRGGAHGLMQASLPCTARHC
ncbi:hypothetical protein [Nannocystis punicea]|uniref:Uncharacterized protein n=1 Tax=Nannocystis punicea TaxID=2995304 RepID=A0ABY7GWX6_9BACT|nr:hypothetical protein [Nannocystis poenicansa]WAS91461.1 hypothetical protein O0S08_35205 [Nannocystis poenicansa]